MNTKKIITVAVVILAVYLIVNDPQGAAGWVQGAGRGLAGAANSLVKFLGNLFH